MMQPSFLARTTFGWPNYFWVALVFALVVAMVPHAAREALHSNTNKAEDWLPDTYAESKELRWFRQHFLSEGFVLVTWDGLTLGNADKLTLLERKLQDKLQDVVPGANDAFRAKVTHRTGKWFRKITSGPSMIADLTQPPLSLSYADAVRRLEGALVGPAPMSEKNLPDDAGRVTCMVVYMSPEGYETNRAMRTVVDYIRNVAINECGVAEPQIRNGEWSGLHMGGPTVDNVAIDRAGEGSLIRLAVLSGLVGLIIAYGCLRNLPLTGVVVAVGATSAAVSLALVYYFGAFEVLALGRDRPFYGAMDAVLMSMPALVYVLAVSGSIHFINYYRESRLAGGLTGAVERAVRGAWIPCGLVALTAAIGFGSLITSDITPIRKFGGFSAVGILATMGVLFSVLPVYLHRYPPASIGRRKWEEMTTEDDRLPPWGAAFYRWLADRHMLVTTVLLAAMCIAAIGLFKLKSSVRLLKLLDEKSDLVRDYTWVENHMANLVPMEVVLAVPPQKRRSPGEDAEPDGRQYRMTMLERLRLVRQVVKRIEDLRPLVSRTLSAVTLAPDDSRGRGVAQIGEDYATNKSLEESRGSFRDYLQLERTPGGQITPDSRELWRISARVTALQDIDYGLFTENLRQVVEPILLTYRRRDELVRILHDRGDQLAGAKLCVLFNGLPNEREPSAESPEGALYNLLRESAGVLLKQRGNALEQGVVSINLAWLSNPELTAAQRTAVLESIRSFDGLIIVSQGLRPDVKSLQSEGASIIDLADLPASADLDSVQLESAGRSQPIESKYTGVIPLVFKTQRQLLTSLRNSLFTSGFMIVLVMAIVFRSAMAGAVSMLPNLFPVVLVFGTLALLDVKMDIGIVMTASVALGVAVDSTVHLVTWFYHGQAKGLTRRESTLTAYDHCAAATVQGAMISGLGLAVFAASSFTPTRQFGYLMIVIQSAALLGDLVLLPALFCGPLGRFFERAPRRGADSPVDDLASLDPEYALVSHEDNSSNGVQHSDNGVDANGEAPSRSTRRDHDEHPLISPTHSALRDKLRSFRRP